MALGLFQLVQYFCAYVKLGGAFEKPGDLHEKKEFGAFWGGTESIGKDTGGGRAEEIQHGYLNLISKCVCGHWGGTLFYPMGSQIEISSDGRVDTPEKPFLCPVYRGILSWKLILCKSSIQVHS